MNRTGHVTDETLVSLVVEGDATALESLYHRHGRTLYSLALRIMGDTHAAEEVLQDTFLQLWLKSLQFDPGQGSLIAWLLTITRHRAITRIRERQSIARNELLADGAGHSLQIEGPSYLDIKISKELVSAAFAGLPSTQREAISMAYFDGLNYAEIASRTQTAPGTVKSGVRSGLKSVKNALTNSVVSEAGSDKPHVVCLKDILITEQLSCRTCRQRDPHEETKALSRLAEVMTGASDKLLDSFLQMPLDLCHAGTAGLSLLEKNSEDAEVFRWTNLSGKLAKYVGGTTPRNFSPCGVTLDCNSPQLFDYPSRYFEYFNKVEVPIVEGLVIPFHIGSKIDGTIWIVSHTEDTKFDSEDARIMTSIAEFAGCALHLNKVLSEKGI